MARKATPRGTTNRRALLGSGREIDLTNEAESTLKKRLTQQWQADAWRFYHEIGEIAYAYDFIAAALRRARLVIALPDDDDGMPIILDPADAPEAYDALDRVKAASGGQGAILATFSKCLGVVGEAYLVCWHPDGEEEWDVFSPDQIVGEGSDWYIRTAPNQNVANMTQLVDGEDFMCRIWNRDPQWRDLAFSAMRPLLTTCDELLILSRAIRGAAVSRLAGAGLLLMPSEMSFGPTDVTEDMGDGGGVADPFTDDLMQVMMTPIEDPTSAAAIVPFVLNGPADYLDKIRHLTFDRPIDPEQAKQRVELLHRIFNGLDLPTEQFEGNANHWNAWLADDQGQDRLESLLTLICAGLTSGYLKPALGSSDAAGKDYMVWYDASAMVKHPNLSTDAEEALTQAAISYAAYRKAKGFAESDEMDEADFERWQQVQAAKRGSGSGWAATDAENEATDAPVTNETTTKGPPEKPDTQDVEEAKEPGTLQASARGPRDRLPLGSELLDLDRAVRNRLQVAADAEMTRTLERVGAKLRRKAGQRGQIADLIRNVDNAAVAQHLGAKLIGQWGDSFTDDALLAGAFLSLAPKWDGWVTQAQRRVVTIANQNGADIDPDTYVEQTSDARTAGWLALTAGLTGLAALRLYNPDVTAPPFGETDLITSVPVGIIRGALSLAGGSTGQIAKSGALLTQDTMGRSVTAPGLATGPDAMNAMRDAGFQMSGYLWSCGSPDRPFEPHQELDGVEFADFGDDQLAADPGEFPYVSVYAPGDHDGCECDAAPILDAIEVDVPDDTEAEAA